MIFNLTQVREQHALPRKAFHDAHVDLFEEFKEQQAVS